MEEVIVSAPVQECLDMKVDKVEADAKLTVRKKPKRRKRGQAKKKLLAKGEGCDNQNTSVGAISSADQDIRLGITSNSFARMEEVIVSAPVQECLDTKVDKAGADAKLTVLKKPRRRIKRQAKKKLLAKGEGTENPSTSVGAIASVDQEMMVLRPAATVDERSSIPSTNTTDQIASGDTLSTKKRKRNQMVKKTIMGDVLSAKVDEVVSGEMVPGKTVTDDTTPKKKPKKRKKKNMKGKRAVLSAKVDEIVSGEMVRDKAVIDSTLPMKKVEDDISSAKVDEIVSGEMALDKAVTDNTTPMKKAEGDVLSAKVNEVSGETVPSKTTTNNTTPKKKKRNKKKRKLTTVAGDILSSCENIQGKVNAIDGSSATEVTEAISGETVSCKAALPDVKMVSKEEEHTEAANGKMVSSAAVNHNVNGAVSNSPTIGKVLTPQNSQSLKADNGGTGPGTTATDTTASKKRKRRKNKKKSPLSGDISSTCENIQDKVNAIDGSSATEVTEAVSGEAVSCKTVLPDVKMVSKEEEHTEAANGKMVSSAAVYHNVNGAVNSSPIIGEILNPQNLQNLKAENGETGPGTTAADTTASKKRKRGKNKKKSQLSGDISSTCENIQDKVNAIDGSSAIKVLDTKVTNKMELSDITNHNLDGKKGPQAVNSEIGASTTASKQKTKKQKVDVNPSENKEMMTQATPGKKLIIFDVNGMLADIVFPRPKDVEADKYSHGKAVFKRPYLDDFLSFCFEKFNVGIWSSRMKKNLDPVVDCLFGNLKNKLLFIWDASHCRNSGMRSLEDRYKFIVFKELREIWVKGTFNESNTLLLDDSPYKALINPKHTGIFPTSYKYTDTNDDCLGPTGALRTYLEGYAAADDGRTYVEQNPFGQGPIDKMNRDWKYYSRVLNSQKEYCAKPI